jgi:hypothetical protein
MASKPEPTTSTTSMAVANQLGQRRSHALLVVGDQDPHIAIFAELPIPAQ